ncbi:hypothetical protein EDD16DRAFT_1716356 [Pisolithus croceorrhizus]|nr:hypothetical protein EDD16DRAFT_1716356 [Pisolithus croceorrhizus]KAI6135304.1 hypothetical protein EV401DRAFT_2203476 [Pisolithus croceorrhizus]KAI6160320.1 hypothetical protein EDD17DRAFT_831253 [Pisolithus thermaeus]
MSSVTLPTRTPVSTSAITPDDVVILIMEETESGISDNFIDKLTKPEEGAEKLSSQTEHVCAYGCYYAGQRFIFVVISGLNNGQLLQGIAFRAIATWLEDTYRQSVELTGVIYIHSITDNSTSSADVQSVNLLGHLCGDKAADRVRLVTTMYDQAEELDADNVKGIPETAGWRSLIEAGARPERFDNTSEEAWKIVEGLENTKKALLLQEELVDMDKRLEDTAAGKYIRPEEPVTFFGRITWLFGF